MLANQIPAAATEVVAFGSAIADLIADIKAGKTAMQDVEDTLADLVAGASGLQNVGADIVKPENQVFLVYAIAQALEPKPAA